MPADLSPTSGPRDDEAVTSVRATDTSVRAAAAALADVEPRPGVPKPDPILVADGVTRRFGGLTAV